MDEKKLRGFLAIISLFLCVSVVLSALTLHNQMKLTGQIKEMQGVTEDTDQEDDVTISGTYVIRSTLPISDAYISGDDSKLDDYQKETKDMAAKVLDEIITDQMTDFEKEKAVYDWLTGELTKKTGILTVVPVNDGDNDNPHDVLKNRSAVCVGYATTFRLFMQMLGIECKVIHSSDLGHSWNLVKLDDGWYHTDCFSDADTTTYQNFNMDDNRCAQEHNWTAEYYPAADGKKYNYVYSMAEELKDIYAVPKWVIKGIIDKKAMMSCTFKKKIDNEEAEKKAQYMAEQLMRQFESSENFYVYYQWSLTPDGEYLFSVFVSYYNNDISAELDKAESEKIDNAINKAMETYYEKTSEK